MLIIQYVYKRGKRMKKHWENPELKELDVQETKQHDLYWGNRPLDTNLYCHRSNQYNACGKQGPDWNQDFNRWQGQSFQQCIGNEGGANAKPCPCPHASWDAANEIVWCGLVDPWGPNIDVES